MGNNRDGNTTAWLISGLIVASILLCVLSAAGAFPAAATIGSKSARVPAGPANTWKEQQTLIDGVTPHGYTVCYKELEDGSRQIITEQWYYRGAALEWVDYNENGKPFQRGKESFLGGPVVYTFYDADGNEVDNR